MAKSVKKLPSEASISEMMHMKGVGRKEAISIIQNPAPHETGEERSARLLKESQKGK